MADKVKIKARFKEKFKTVALPNDRLDEIADKLANRLQDDADDAAIDAELDFLNEVYPFLEQQKAYDRAVNEKRKQEQQNKKSTDTGSASGAQSSDDTPTQKQDNQEQENEKVPAWAKALIDETQALKAKLSEQVQTKKADQFLSQAKQRGIPEHIAALVEINENSDLDTAISKVETAWKNSLAETNTGNKNGTHTPLNPHGNPGKKQATAEEIDSIQFN